MKITGQKTKAKSTKDRHKKHLKKRHQQNQLCVAFDLCVLILCVTNSLYLIFTTKFSYINYSIYKAITHYLLHTITLLEFCDIGKVTEKGFCRNIAVFTLNTIYLYMYV